MTTPSKAIKLECRWCNGGVRGSKCDSKMCKLKDNSLSKAKRIKAHCLDCVETLQEVRNCTGKLLSEDRLCYLHPYRFGYNQKKRKQIGTATIFIGQFWNSRDTILNYVCFCSSFEPPLRRVCADVDFSQIVVDSNVIKRKPFKFKVTI